MGQTTTLNSFAQSTGQAAGQKTGEIAGKLLGKVANGLEALAAMKALSEGKVSLFMELAKEAAHVLVQKLDTLATKPFATPDLEFNGTLDIAKSFARAYSNERQKAPAMQKAQALERSAPSLGLGSSGGSAHGRKKTDKKEE